LNLKKLILAAAPESYSKDTHIALGTWCFVGKEDLPGWEDGEFAPDPFANEQDWLDAEQRMDRLIQRYAPAVATFLNEKNQTRHSEEYWRVLIHHWLSAFFLNFVLREKIIDRAIEKYGHEPVEVELLEVTGDFQFDSSNQFVYDGVNSQAFNHWMFSEILKTKRPATWTVKTTKTTAEQLVGVFAPAQVYWKVKVLSLLEEFSRFRRVYGVRLWQQWLLGSALWFKRAPKLPRNYEPTVFPARAPGELDWDSLLKKTVPRSLLNIQSIDSKFLFFRKGLLVLCGTLLYTDERWKVKLANFVENGGFYYTAQHGCNYGVALVHASLKWVESWRTRFISWGWKHCQDYDLEAIPASAPLLSTLNQRHAQTRQNSARTDLIYVGRDPNPFVYNLYPCTQPNQLIRYRQKKVEFLSSLTPEIQKTVRYRPAPFNPVSLQDKEYILKRFPEMQVCAGDLHTQLYQSKLVVCDSPGTTYHICMAANIPVIGVWPSEEYLFVPQTRELFEGLKKCGAIFEDPISAAEKVNAVATEIETWWNSDAVQKARRAWNDRNARHSPEWFSEWFQMLRKF
jgi:hypothetical protein